MTRDLIEKTFDKNIDYFEILIKSGTNLIFTYKDRDQFNGLLVYFKYKTRESK